jgi:intracellular septation protein
VFFLAYRHFSPREANAGIGTVVAVTKGTVAFMVATIVALIVEWRLGRIADAVAVDRADLGFGTLTVLLAIRSGSDQAHRDLPAVRGRARGLVRASHRCAHAAAKRVRRAGRCGLDEAFAQLGVLLLFLAVLNEVLQTHAQLRWLASGQAVGRDRAVVPVHLRADPHAAETRAGRGSGDEVEQNPPHDYFSPSLCRKWLPHDKNV